MPGGGGDRPEPPPLLRPHAQPQPPHGLRYGVRRGARVAITVTTAAVGLLGGIAYVTTAGGTEFVPSKATVTAPPATSPAVVPSTPSPDAPSPTATPSATPTKTKKKRRPRPADPAPRPRASRPSVPRAPRPPARPPARPKPPPEDPNKGWCPFRDGAGNIIGYVPCPR